MTSGCKNPAKKHVTLKENLVQDKFKCPEQSVETFANKTVLRIGVKLTTSRSNVI